MTNVVNNGSYNILKNKRNLLIDNMAYIPKEHKKYNLLPICNSQGGEVFDYSSKILDCIENITGTLHLTPYGYKSYQEYYDYLDNIIKAYTNNDAVLKLLIKYKKSIMDLNIKEDWSIVKYIGDSTGYSLTNGKMYYWPTSKNNPIYRGVIDDEEFTSYIYPTDLTLWEIIEDPSGMAFSVLYSNGDSKLNNKF